MKTNLLELVKEIEHPPGPLVMQVLLEDELGHDLAPSPAPARKAANVAERMRRYRARKILYRQLLKARSLGLPISDAVSLLHSAWQANPPTKCPPRQSA